VGVRLLRFLALAAIVGGIVTGAASSAPQVVGGTPIQVQSAPWAVFVQSDTDAFELDCSGSVIDATHVVTAAHCMFDTNGTKVDAADITVLAGISNFQAPDSTEQQRPVSSLRIHPGFDRTNETSGIDDVAVLTLAAPLDLSGPAVRAVALPVAGAPFPRGASTTVAGFGLEDAHASSANGPLESSNGTVEWQGGCGGFSFNDFALYDNGVILCEQSPASAICNGDSGAGVVTTSGAPTLVGVADAGEDGCPPGSDGIAAYVGAPEILSFIQGNDSPPTAPRGSRATTSDLTWGAPLVPRDTLRCAAAGWPGSVQLSYAFFDVSSGTILQNGASSTFVLTTGDIGRTVECETEATNSGGTTVGYTNATPRVEPPPKVRIARIAPLAGRRGRTLIVSVVLTAPAGLSGTFGVCVAPPAAVAARRCVNRTEPFGASGAFRFAVPLAIKSSAPVGAARIAIEAVAGLSAAKTTATLRVAKS